jgi:hypothetical protein
LAVEFKCTDVQERCESEGLGVKTTNLRSVPGLIWYSDETSLGLATCQEVRDN